MLPNVATIANYGDVKQNHLQVSDPSTDLDANDYNEMISDLAGVTQTAVRAWRTFVGTSSVGAAPDPVTNIHGAVWGTSPALKPAVYLQETGVYVVEWPTTIPHELGGNITLSIRGVHQPIVQSNVAYLAWATVLAPNAVAVYVSTPYGEPANANGLPITISVF